MVWIHIIGNVYICPRFIVHSPFVHATAECWERKLSTPKVKEQPVSGNAGWSGWKPHTLPFSQWSKIAASCLLAFPALLHYDEVAKVRCYDITFSDMSMAEYIIASKTYQYHGGGSVLIARTGSPTCPVAMMESFLTGRAVSVVLVIYISRRKRY